MQTLNRTTRLGMTPMLERGDRRKQDQGPNSSPLGHQSESLLRRDGQSAEPRNGTELSIWLEPISGRGAHQQQFERNHERRRPVPAPVEDPAER